MSKFKCTKCGNTSFRRVRRISWQRHIPGLKKYECSSCYTTVYKLFGIRIYNTHY